MPSQTLFQSAASLLGLTLGIPKVDSLLGGLKGGTQMLITGESSNLLAERLCIRSILAYDATDTTASPIYIDAGNCSDIYTFTAYAKRYRLDPKQALQHIVTSRAFTIYQLANLVLNELPLIIRKFASTLLVVAEPLLMFDDPQVDMSEAEKIVGTICRSLRKLKHEENLLVVLTSTKKSPLLGLLLKHSDIVLKTESNKAHSVTICLLKHPSRRLLSVSVSRNEFFGVKPRYVLREVLVHG